MGQASIAMGCRDHRNNATMTLEVETRPRRSGRERVRAKMRFEAEDAAPMLALRFRDALEQRARQLSVDGGSYCDIHHDAIAAAMSRQPAVGRQL